MWRSAGKIHRGDAERCQEVFTFPLERLCRNRMFALRPAQGERGEYLNSRQAMFRR